MKHIITFFLLSAALGLALAAAGCGNATGPAATTTNQNANAPDAYAGHEGHDTTAAKFKAALTAAPADIQAGAETTLTFNVKDSAGKTVKDLSIVHEKPMHLLIVSADLAGFYHIHPEPQADGSYQVKHTFPNGGAYKLYADYTPAGAAQVVDIFDVKANGTERAAAPLTEDKTLTKTVDGLAVTMSPDKPVRAGDELMLNFQVNDAATGKPAADLQKYLGELAHFVIISQDLKQFIHAHPMSGGAQPADGMKHDDKGMKHDGMKMPMNGPAPKVSAHTTFPAAGLYKLWAQFQRGGKVIAVPFVLRVAEGSPQKAANDAPAPADAIKITVGKDGYSPSSINVKAGQSVKLAFYRPDANNCGGEVIFPKLKLTKKLPVGATTVVEIAPQESGELAFSCGMGMLRGKVVVE